MSLNATTTKDLTNLQSVEYFENLNRCSNFKPEKYK